MSLRSCWKYVLVWVLLVQASLGFSCMHEGQASVNPEPNKSDVLVHVRSLAKDALATGVYASVPGLLRMYAALALDCAPRDRTLLTAAEDPTLRAMARSLGLDPSDIVIISARDGATASSSTLTKKIILLGTDELASMTDQQRAFVMGHELVHISRKAVWRIAVCQVLAASIIGVGLAVCDLALQRLVGMELFKSASQVTDPRLNFLKDATHAILSCPLLAMALAWGVARNLSRREERIADQTSARTFGCAAAGVQIMDAYDNARKNRLQATDALIARLRSMPTTPCNLWGLARAYARKLGYRVSDTLDGHPSYEERSAYIRIIAAQQAEHGH